MNESPKGWRRLLASRAAPAVAIALGVTLATPSLTCGLSADDYFHELVASGRPLPGMPTSRLDPFRFADGQPEHNLALVDEGVFPWWSDPTVRLAFFRPVAALTHYADFALWPRAPLLMHAQSLLWFALALVAVWLVYRRLIEPPWAAGLALVLYALDDAHGPAVGWIANRNAMVALALGLPALWLHDRSVRGGFRAGRWLAPAALAIGLLGGEAVIAVVGYLIAYALTLEDGPLGERLLRLWPYGVVLAVWRFVYQRLGYGAHGSGIYLDPVHDAAAYLHALPARAAALLVGQLGFPWSDFSEIYPFISHRAVVIMTSVLAAEVALFVWLFADVVRRDRVARFFALGLLFALVPVASTFAADRLLWFVGVGGMGLLARFFAAPKSWPRKIVAAPLVLLHLVLAPPLLAIRSRSTDTVEVPLARAERSLPDGPDIAEKTVVLVNPPSTAVAGYIQLTRAARGTPRPAHIRWLATGTSGVELVREGAQTIRVRPGDGFLENLGEQMFRTTRAPFAAGWSLALSGVTIEVTDVDAYGRPREARFHFATPLEDPSLVWMKWGARGYEPFVPPAPGARASLAPLDFLASMFAPPEKRAR